MQVADIKNILGKYPGNSRVYLIPILQDIQDYYGYLPGEAIAEVANFFEIPPTKVYSIATYYNQFYFEKPGKFHLQVCTGTGCHLENGGRLRKEIFKLLEIRDGEMTRDGFFSLEMVPCLGACHEAPVIRVNGKLHGRLTAKDLARLLDKLRTGEHGIR